MCGNLINITNIWPKCLFLIRITCSFLFVPFFQRFTLSNFKTQDFYDFPFFKISKPLLLFTLPLFPSTLFLYPQPTCMYILQWQFSGFYPFNKSLQPCFFQFSFLFSLFDRVEMIHHPILYKTSFLNSLCLVATSQNLITHGIVWKGVCSRWSLKWSPTFPFINFHFA